MKNKRIVSALSFLICIAIISALLPINVAAQSDTGKKRILFISSYSFAWGSVPFQIDGISDGLGDDYVVNYEFMDTKNTKYTDGYHEFYELMKYKLETRLPYDAVFVCDDAALAFVQLYKDDLFQGLPIVFSGIDNIQNAMEAAEQENVTGIVEQVDYAANMELAHSLFPKAHRLVLILDDMENGVGIADQLKASSDAFADYEVEYLNSSEYTPEEFTNKLASLDESSIVFGISMGQYKNGVVYSEEERYALVRDYVNIPMFRFSQSGVGKGWLGGYIVDHQESCKIAALMLRQILETDIEPEINMNTPYCYYFDYNVMSKYSIKKSDFPDIGTKNCIILNEPQSFLEKHAFTIVISLFALLLLLLIYTICNRYHSMKQLSEKNIALAKTAEDENKANMATKNFLARMSHDMRTPMNGILGLSYIIEDQISDPEVCRELHQLRDSGDYLLQLINDVLDINKVASGNLTLRPMICDEELVFDSIISFVEPQMKKKNIIFTFVKKNIDWKWMLLDAQRVKQIFINLLSNAAKFTPDGGRIDFVMELFSETETMIRDKFIIRDTGIGMSADFVPHAFEPFAQENRIEENLGGTGLGLSIVKNLVEQMGGNITLESEEGKGTTFTLYLNFPLAEKPMDAEREVKHTDNNTSLKDIHILLCEDHPLNAQIAERLLEKKGAIVTVAENGKVGLEKFSQSTIGYFQVILMDIRMPEMDGLSTARNIRLLDRTDAKAVPIIAMTANAYDSDIQESLDAGMNAHIAKPIEPQHMYETIYECIKNEETSL